VSDLRKAAEAVLERWDSPAWEWMKQGPTAELMAALRTALAAPCLEVTVDPRLTPDEAAAISSALAAPDEIEALRRDAERYRWMKREVKRIPPAWDLVGWDAAIDAAMQEVPR
jgi:hypothetical protein